MINIISINIGTQIIPDVNNSTIMEVILRINIIK